MPDLPDDTGPLPYFPVRLGTPVGRSKKPSGDEGQLAPRDYEAWRESFVVERQAWSERAEVDAFAELCRGGTGFQLILGEPGAGKSRLLEEWFRRWWIGGGTVASFGERVPVLVRLRFLKPVDIELADASFADRLWALAERERHLLSPGAAGHYRPERARCYRPIWLLDGIDELPVEVPLSDWLPRLGTLPGTVAATCRTAVWQAERLMGQIGLRRAETILPLRSGDEQANFLRPVLGEAADRLAGFLDRHATLSPLAGNPLLLGLVRELWQEDPGLLPTSRAAFYRGAVARLWRRKVPREVLDQTRERDRVLARLAERMGLKPEVEKGILEDCVGNAGATQVLALLDGLRACGVLRIDDAREKVSFLHLTFQEYFLSAALVAGGGLMAIERHWLDPRYEEVLALLLARLAADGWAEEAVRGIDLLVRKSVELTADREKLHQIGRSPLRVALHLIARAGLEAGALADAWPQIDSLIGVATTRAFAAAKDERMPVAVLEKLASDPDATIRKVVAANPSTSPRTLDLMASDVDADIRFEVARNHSTPSTVLERLSSDPDSFVRAGVAMNPSTSAEALKRLAKDPEKWVRQEVARNLAIPKVLLERMINDPDAEVRANAVKNPSIPPIVLEKLSRQTDDWIREWVAENQSVPPRILEQLSGDPITDVRKAVAGNHSTPVLTLRKLASDQDSDVRWIVARNPFMPTEVLEKLARDLEVDVRRSIAENLSTPALTLERLAGDPDWSVRQSTASNPSAPSLALERLADDPDADVRQVAGRNPSMPEAALKRLTDDLDATVRQGVAGNPSASMVTLDRLACDPTRSVRFVTAENPSTTTLALELLGDDPDDTVRRVAASNPSTLLESLVERPPK